MKATICFKDKEVPPLELFGEALGIYELGSFTQMKDYGLDHKKIIASIPTDKIQFITYTHQPFNDNL